MTDNGNPEVSIVMPCLNEAETLEVCIRKAQSALADHDIRGEIIVADNGSTDGSRDVARRMGASVVEVGERGYGSALTGGIQAARGRFIIMGDADDSYDFLDVPRFVSKLREGYSLVQGCRLPSGGGKILPGAMPFLHRWIGNPFFSRIARGWFKAPVNDVYCGLRGFSSDLFRRLDLRCTGMEFAIEMLTKASLLGENIAEVPITLYPDGRTGHAPHLKTFRDGWRSLRFFLLMSPRKIFLTPGIVLLLLGLFGYGLALPGVRIGGVLFDAHTLLFSSLAILMGQQSILLCVHAKTFSVNEGLLPEDTFYRQFNKFMNLERAIALSILALVIGGVLLLMAINKWRLAGFGNLDYSSTMKLVIPGVTLFALGFQTMLAGFFVSILGMQRR